MTYVLIIWLLIQQIVTFCVSVDYFCTLYMKRRASAPISARRRKRAKPAPRKKAARKTLTTLNAEGPHYFDAERAAYTIPNITTNWAGAEVDATTGTGPVVEKLCLFAPIQGDDIANRQGRFVFVKTIRIHGVLIVPAQVAQTSADASLLIRALVIHDKQTNAAQFNSEDVLASGLAILPMHQFRNVDFLKRFTVLKDKKFKFATVAMVNDGAGPPPTIAQAGQRQYFDWTFKINKLVEYNATNGGTVADIMDNSWHFMIGTDGAALAPTISYKVRTVFTP